MAGAHPIRCNCGAFEARVAATGRSTRAVCYCKDCQAFAHFLGLPAGMLDALGGTDIVAVRPANVEFLRGQDRLACMSLTPTGTLRWYAACCRTPIGNTPRDWKQSHVGLIHTALEQGGRGIGEAFGPVRMHVSRESAKGTAPRTAAPAFAGAVLRYLAGLSAARVSGRYRVNPFFDANGRPVRQPQVLSAAELARLKASL